MQDNGATRRGPGSRCCHGGGEVAIVHPVLVGLKQEGESL